MNPSHYPSLELCKKLKEIWFPEGEKYYDSGWEYGECFTVYPSVMEMLDVIPKEYTFELYSTYWNENDYWTPDNPYDWELNPLYKLRIYDQDEFETIPKSVRTQYRNNIPDAIAVKILWLHENNYISFNK